MCRVAGRLMSHGLGVLSTLMLAGCFAGPGETPTALLVGDGLWGEYVVSDARHPTALALAADGRVFYTEKDTGSIRVVAAGELLAEPFATVPVNSAGQRGLLGIALHPDFDDNGRVYAFYTRSDTGQATTDVRAVVDNRVVYFEADGNVAAGGEIFVASLPAGAGTTRIGGRIAFAADGTLLVTLGDLGDTTGAASPTAPVGKILRYNDDGSIPADNPTADSPVYARGLRDPRGLCVDPASGVPLMIDRNADGHYEEINRVLPGRDFGWPAVVGIADSPEELEYAATHADYADPLRQTGTNNLGLVGGSFNPSTRYGPNVQLNYFYGERHTRRVRYSAMNTARDGFTSNALFAHYFPSDITDVAFTPAGTLYVACEDAVLRVVPTP